MISSSPYIADLELSQPSPSRSGHDETGVTINRQQAVAV
jgi:hypothetical protein